MKRVEIELEHFYKNKFVGRKRLKPDSDMTVIGQTKDCQLRLLGEGVSNLHAVIEFQEEKWTISDLGSDQGTWVKKKPVVCHEILGPTTIRIGQHSIKAIPKTIESHLFLDEQKPAETNQLVESDVKGELKQYHQIITRKNSFVVSSQLIEPTDAFTFSTKEGETTLNPPSDETWVKTEFGDDVVIQQRLVTTKVIEETNKEKIESLWDPNLKKPMAIALALLLILGALIALNPVAPDNELEELKPEKNRYAKMIYDAKAIRKKRLEAKKVRKSIAQHSQNMQAPAKSETQQIANSQASSKNTKVMKKIRAAGLSQLIGKISKRAAKSAVFIKATGKTPDNKFTGRSTASVGSLAKNAKESSQYKINAVTTAGKAGGKNSYKNVGGLSLGNVGNASVGILEEETEIQGGLDKDVIARIIEKHLGQIRYCYERQLSASPDLYGKVMVKFTIDGSGSVVAQNVGKTTLRSAMVEGCILRRISGWKFPKPKGGTRVLVSYPFLFKSTN